MGTLKNLMELRLNSGAKENIQIGVALQQKALETSALSVFCLLSATYLTDFLRRKMTSYEKGPICQLVLQLLGTQKTCKPLGYNGLRASCLATAMQLFEAMRSMYGLLRWWRLRSFLDP
jgi:hypothetical protein